MINGNMIGIGSAPLKTLIIEDENGNALTGVVTDSVVIFDATVSDVRQNKTFASSEGVQVGEKEILEYRTTKGQWFVEPGDDFSIPLSKNNKYNYTNFQCIISLFSTSIQDSVESKMVTIGDSLYYAGSNVKISDISKNSKNKSIDLNITNDTDDVYVIFYFTCKEEEN